MVCLSERHHDDQPVEWTPCRSHTLLSFQILGIDDGLLLKIARCIPIQDEGRYSSNTKTHVM